MAVIKKIKKRMDEMCAPAFLILKSCFILSFALMLAAALIMVSSGTLSADTFERYLLVKELISMPPVILLIAIIGSTYIEEKLEKGK